MSHRSMVKSLLHLLGLTLEVSVLLAKFTGLDSVLANDILLLHLKCLSLVGNKVTLPDQILNSLMHLLLLHRHGVKLVLKVLDNSTVYFLLLFQTLSMLLLSLP